MKGIILAGGLATRMWPASDAVTKQLMPVYDKPLIHYPLATLMLAGVNDIMMICKDEDRQSFERLFKNSSNLGLSISFRTQNEPKGIAQALSIGADFIGNDSVVLILGDNIFHGPGLGASLREINTKNCASVFLKEVSNPSDFGVAALDANGKLTQIVEKPEIPPSNWAVTGLYFYPPGVTGLVTNLRPSERGEYEITDLNNIYLKDELLQVHFLQRSTVWFDTGSFTSIHDAATYVRLIEEHHEMKIACIEEIALHNGWMKISALQEIIENHKNSMYTKYLRKLLIEYEK